jgi:hypothetical protein
MRKQKLKPFSVAHLNAWRMHKQWLDRPFKGRSPLDLIRSVGWIYSPGCATPYLSLWARMASFRASTLNKIVFKEQKLIEMETLRGNTMLVPAEQAGVALRVRTRTFTELAEQAEGMLPLTRREMDRLKSAVRAALESTAKNEDEILNAVPSGLVREFPSTLRRIGMTGSLRLAINLLKEEGRIVKVRTGKRLDTSEHSFALLSDLLPQVDAFELKPELANTELATLYFGAEGPARIKDFAWWSGLHVTEAMRAAEAIQPRLQTVSIAGNKDEFLMPESDLKELAEFKPTPSAVNFIPFRDVFLKGQREIAARFMPPQHSDKPFTRMRGRILSDPLATILCDGEVVGIWEWASARKGKLDFVLFDDTLPASVLTRIKKRATKLGSFIRDELGGIRAPSNGLAPRVSTGIRDLKESWEQPHALNAGSV